MFWEEYGFFIVTGCLEFIILIPIIYGIYRIIKAICKTIVLNTKIKYFGTSQEYEDFKAWRKSQNVDTSERSDEG